MSGSPIHVVEYLTTESGNSPFARWLEAVDIHASAKITTTLYRMEQGNFSHVKGGGSGVFEYRIDFGPAYRVHFGKDGKT